MTSPCDYLINEEFKKAELPRISRRKKKSYENNPVLMVLCQLLFTLYYIVCMCAKSLQLCLTLYDPMGCSMPGSSVHGILQARILEWVVMPFSRGSS